MREELQQHIIGFVTTVLQGLGFADAPVTVDLSESDDELVIRVRVIGEDLGILIGAYGKNISSLHHLLLQVIHRKIGKLGKKVMLDLDIADYYTKQDQKVLAQLAEAVEEMRVLEESYEFPPMAPRLRRVIHLEIETKYPGIRSESMGEGTDRRVVLHLVNGTDTTPSPTI